MAPAPSPSIDVVSDARRAASVLSPLRRRILESLDAPDSAAGLARRMGLPRQRLNYHLRELEREGFVELAEERQRRGCVERLLRVTARTWLIDPALLGLVAADPDKVQDRFSSAYLIAVASRLVGEVTELRRRAESAGKKLATISLQAEIDFESPAALSAFTDDLSVAIAALVRKYHREGPQSRPHRLVVGAHPLPESTQSPGTGQTTEASS
jgi:DNA-binding transcriptional ArsR family regulator